jgi:predicted DNA-binding protein
MKQITILITDEQHKKLKERAKVKEIRISEQIRRAIEHYLNEIKKST